MDVEADRPRYEADRAKDLALAATHGIDEVMNANWNPDVNPMFHDVARPAISSELPEDFSAFDVDTFLDKFYALATPI